MPLERQNLDVDPPAGQIPTKTRSELSAERRGVIATYQVSGLENGFTVHYADDSGVEWEFEVSAEDAAKALLLTLKPLG